MASGLYVLNSVAAIITLILAGPARAQVVQSTGDATPQEAIVVAGQRSQQERTIELKRQASGVVDVVAADDIGRLPDHN